MNSSGKNHQFLVEVFNEIAKKDDNARLLLVGDGEDRDKIRQFIIDQGLNKKVIFTGAVSNVDDYLMAMDVFVLPSRFEGLPIVGIEAQASDLPVIAAVTVTKELDLTGEVLFLPLENPTIWAEETLKFRGRTRNRLEGFLRNHGYSANQTAEHVRRLYGVRYEEQI